MTVSVVSCVYGQHGTFLEGWTSAVLKLDPRPDAVSVAGDEYRGIVRFLDATEITQRCEWTHPQAFYLQQAIEAADTDWVVIADVDDLLLPDALAGLEDVQADVWQMGFDRSDGERYIPPTMSADEVLAMTHNVLVGASAIRTEAFHAAGGFPDIALQDWGLWRRLARAGCTFESSGRTHFRYMRHDTARGTVELTNEARADHLAEMMAAEDAWDAKRCADFYVENYAHAR